MVGKRSKRLVTAQRHYHECPNCGEKDLCRTDSVHRCKACGNVWSGAVKKPLPLVDHARKGLARSQPAPRPEELLARLRVPEAKRGDVQAPYNATHDARLSDVGLGEKGVS